jgi:hypothetical protein
MAKDKTTVYVVTIGFNEKWCQYIKAIAETRLTKQTWVFHHFSELSSKKFETKTQVLLVVYCPAVMDGQELNLLQQVVKANVGQLWPTILFLDDRSTHHKQLPEQLQEIIDEVGVGGNYLTQPDELDLIRGIRQAVGLSLTIQEQRQRNRNTRRRDKK